MSIENRISAEPYPVPNCGRLNNDPKDVHVQILGTCDCVILQSKRDLTDMIKDLEM